MKARRIVLFAGMLAGLLSLLTLRTVQAQQGTWTGNGSSADWNDVGNWVGGVVAGDWGNVIFDNNTVNGTANINYLKGTGAINLNSGLTQNITINGSVGAPLINNGTTITIAPDSADLTVNAPYLLWGTATWDVGAGRTLTFNGGSQGSESVVKNGVGTVVLPGTNTYSGQTYINAGALVLSDPAGLGSGGANINNGAQLTLNHSGTTPNAINLVGGNQILWVGSSANGSGNTTTPTLTGNITSDGNSGTLTIYSAGWQSGINNLTFSGNTIALQNQSLSVWGQNGGNVDSIAQAYNQKTTLNNATLTTSANVNVGRGALQVQGGSNVTIAGQLLASNDWAGFIMQDSASVTVASGIDFFNVGYVATDLALNGGTLSTPFIYGNDFAGQTHVYFNGVRVVATADNTDFLQVHLNRGAAYTAGGLIGNGGLIFNDGGHNVTINNPLYDAPGQSGSLTKVGGGTLTLTGNNTYSGVTNINEGALRIQNSRALGVGGFNGSTMTFVRDGATLEIDGSLTIDEHMHLAGSGVGGNGALRVLGGNSTFTTAIAFDDVVKIDVAAGASLTQTNVFYDVGGLIKSGSGTLTLAGANSYSGATTVNGGVLTANALGAIPTASDVFVGTSATAGTLDVTGYAQTINSITIGANGTLDLSVLHPLTSGLATFETGAKLNISGATGAEPVMYYSGLPTGTFNIANVTGLPGLPGQFTLAYNLGELDIVSAVTDATWASHSTSSWNTPGNWQDSAVPGTNIASLGQDTATFGGGLATVEAITLDTSVPVDLKSLVFSASNYTLSGGSLTLQGTTGTATVTVSSGTQTIESSTVLTLASSTNMVIQGAASELKIQANVGESGLLQSLTKLGSGTLVLSGTNSYTGGTIVNEGILAVTDSHALPDNQSLIVGAGGTLIFDPSFSGSPVAASPVSSLAASPVPEPSTLALLFAGLVVGLGVWRRGER